jgi:hypothetical protein
MGMTRSWNLEILDPRLSAITMDSANRPSVYEKLLTVRAWNLAKDKMPDQIKTAEYGGLGPFNESYEKGVPDSDDAVKGPTKTTAFRKFALSTEFSEEVREDDLFGVPDVIAGELGKSYKLTREIQTAQIFDNAFNTTYYTTADGAAICSASHLSYGGGATRTNILSDSDSFSYGGMQDLLLVGRRQTDHRGYPDPQFNPGDTITFVIQPEDEWKATEILNAMAAKNEPGTPNHTINVILANCSANVVSNEFASGTGATSTRLWFILNKGGGSGIELIDRTALRTKNYTRDGDDSLVVSGRARYAFHTPTWRGILGSGN